MDCGEGVQTKLGEFRLGLNKETTILISHLHGDHVTGLLGLLQTMSLSQRTLPVTIVAPAPLFSWLKITAETLHIGLSFEIKFIPVRPGIILRHSEYIIRASRAVHSIEAYCYSLEEKQRPGVFHPKKALTLGLPEGKLWSTLQRGKEVRYQGAVIYPNQVVGPPRKGRKVGYSGDTRPARRLAAFFNGADLLILDSTFSARDATRALERRHSTSVEAALLAKEARAKKLVLTHFSARYKNVGALLREARKIFPNAIAAYDGLTLDVPYSGR
jgi:ribonuclease Z